MSIEIELIIIKGKNLDARLRRIVVGLHNRFDPHDKAGSYMRERTRDTMKQGADPEGKSHSATAPLKASTIQRRKFPDKPILIQSGRLRRSVRYEVKVGASSALGAFIKSTNVGTSTLISPEKSLSRRKSIKARVHQFGSKKNKTPARPFMGITDRDSRKIERIFDQFVAITLERHDNS